MKFFLCTLVFLKLFLINSHASSYEHAYVEKLAQKALEAHFKVKEHEKVTIKVTPIDPRIKIKPCQVALKANIPEKNSGRNVNVKISCDGSLSWNMYLSAKIETTLPVLVAKKTISKGSVINHDDIEIVHLSNTKIRGSVINNQKLILGAKAEKRIAKGKPFNSRNICLVCKGDIVTIIAKTANFNIKTQGEALNSGNVNEQIKIRNSRSNKVITATVKTINTVEINL
jgi:flagella basal body P-ring formation protein FlgA